MLSLRARLPLLPNARLESSDYINRIPLMARSFSPSNSILQIRGVGSLKRTDVDVYRLLRTRQFMSESKLTAAALALLIFDKYNQVVDAEVVNALRKEGWLDVANALSALPVSPEQIQRALKTREKKERAEAKLHKRKVEWANEFTGFYDSWRQKDPNRRLTEAEREYWAARAYVWSEDYGSGKSDRMDDPDVSVRRLHYAAQSALANWREFRTQGTSVPDGYNPASVILDKDGAEQVELSLSKAEFVDTQDVTPSDVASQELDFSKLFRRVAETHELYEADWIESIEDQIRNVNRLVAWQDWDSGGSGAGGGRTSLYLFRGVFICDSDAGFRGPFETFADAIKYSDVFVTTDATREIWVQEDFREEYSRIRLGSP